MAATLVLNATYEPLCIVPLRRAIVLVLSGKAIVIEDSEQRIHSARLNLPAPTVVRLARFVRVPYRGAAALTRRAVLERDGHRCVYCERGADTIDHVVPRSRGGRNEWTNVVAACARCNHRKGDKLHEMVERLSARLGPQQVLVPATRADHRPEQAQDWQPALRGGSFTAVAPSKMQDAAAASVPGGVKRVRRPITV